MKIDAKLGTAEDAMLTATAEFLRQNGWQVVVIGGLTVVRGPLERKHLFEIAIQFTGKKVAGRRSR